MANKFIEKYNKIFALCEEKHPGADPIAGADHDVIYINLTDEDLDPYIDHEEFELDEKRCDEIFEEYGLLYQDDGWTIFA